MKHSRVKQRGHFRISVVNSLTARFRLHAICTVLSSCEGALTNQVDLSLTRGEMTISLPGRSARVSGVGVGRRLLHR